MLVLLAVTKCQQNMLLKKNRLTNADELVDFSETAVSSCDSSERFDDGTNRENIKCTTTRQRVGVWSHPESACHGRPTSHLGSPVYFAPAVLTECVTVTLT